MNLELELLINAWDHYKADAIKEEMTPAEIEMESAINKLLDDIERIKKLLE